MILATAGCSLILLAEVSKVDAFWSHMSASGKFRQQAAIGKVFGIRGIDCEAMMVQRRLLE